MITTTDSWGRTGVNWPLVFLSVAAGGLVVLALKRSNVPPFAGISCLVLATVIVVVFAGASLLYWWDSFRTDAGDDDTTR